MKRSPAKPIKLTPVQIQEIETAVFQLAEVHLDPRCYLLDVAFEKETGYWYLRIYIEGKDAPVSLDDCERVSRELDALLDTQPLLQDLTFYQEVSSPGVFRPLRRQREFDFYIGRPIRIEAKPPEKKSKQPIKSEMIPQEGILQGFDAARNVVTFIPNGSGKAAEMALGDTLLAYLNPELHLPDEQPNEAKTNV